MYTAHGRVRAQSSLLSCFNDYGTLDIACSRCLGLSRTCSGRCVCLNPDFNSLWCVWSRQRRQAERCVLLFNNRTGSVHRGPPLPASTGAASPRHPEVLSDKVCCQGQQLTDYVLVRVSGATWPLGGEEEEEESQPSSPPLSCSYGPDGRTHQRAWLSPPSSSSSSSPPLLPVLSPSSSPHLLPSSLPCLPTCPLPPCCGLAAGGEPEEADSGRRPCSARGPVPVPAGP